MNYIYNFFIMKQAILKVLFVLMLVPFVAGCNNDDQAPEGTLKVTFKGAPSASQYQVRMRIYPICSNSALPIKDVLVPNNSGIEISLNIGDYYVQPYLDPSSDSYYMGKESFQIQRGKTTEVVYGK